MRVKDTPIKRNVAIVIATFNCLEKLQCCIESINTQSFNDYEVLISDGGSSDGTKEYIESGEIRNLTWYKSSQDSGIYSALNQAFAEINAKWVIVLGADDSLADGYALSRATSYLKNMPQEVGIAYSNLFIASKGTRRLKRYPSFTAFQSAFSGGAFIHHQSAFFRHDCILRSPPFNEKYKIHADYDLMLNVLKSATGQKIEDVYVVFDSSGFSSKLANYFSSINEIIKIRKSNDLPAFSLNLVLIYLKQFVRIVSK